MLYAPSIGGAKLLYSLAFWYQKVSAVKHYAGIRSALYAEALTPGARKPQIAPKVLCPASLVAFAEYN